MNDILLFFWQIFQTIWLSIEEFLSPILGFISGLFQNFIPILINLFNMIIGALSAIIDGFLFLVNSISSFFGG